MNDCYLLENQFYPLDFRLDLWNLNSVIIADQATASTYIPQLGHPFFRPPVLPIQKGR
jgi:hypothetical protein